MTLERLDPLWAAAARPVTTGAAILALIAAACAHSLNGSITHWQQRAWAAAEETAARQRGGVARSVQQQRITTLNLEVVPYLSRVVENEVLSDSDRDEARRLARAIRELLVADIERGWAATLLDEVVARLPHLNIVARADDPENAGRAATLEPRTLLRAIAELSIRRLAATELDLRLRNDDGRQRGIIELVRGVTEWSRVRDESGQIALEFDYGF